MILMYPKVSISPNNMGYHAAIREIGFASGICYNAPTHLKEHAELEEYVQKRIAAKHESVLEHVSLSVEFTCDRGVTHEIVRHRLAAFTQSSTRYIDYDGEREGSNCKFIIPPWVKLEPGEYNGHDSMHDHFASYETGQADAQWFCDMLNIESSYRKLRQLGGWRPEQARSVLPNSTMARIKVTTNIREWQHILRLRAVGTTGKPHVQMTELMVPLLLLFAVQYPVFFEPILEQYVDKHNFVPTLRHYRTEVQ